MPGMALPWDGGTASGHYAIGLGIHGQSIEPREEGAEVQ